MTAAVGCRHEYSDLVGGWRRQSRQSQGRSRTDRIHGWLGDSDAGQSVGDPGRVPVPTSGTIDYQYVIMPSGHHGGQVRAVRRDAADATASTPITSLRSSASPAIEVVEGRANRRGFCPQRKQGRRRRRWRSSGDLLGGYAPGTVAPMLKPGQAKLIKAGSDIVFQLHYTADGKAGDGQEPVGRDFLEGEADLSDLCAAVGNQWASSRFLRAIPTTRFRQRSMLQRESTLMMFLPHMHLRGKDIE